MSPQSRQPARSRLEPGRRRTPHPSPPSRCSIRRANSRDVQAARNRRPNPRQARPGDGRTVLSIRPSRPGARAGYAGRGGPAWARDTPGQPLQSRLSDGHRSAPTCASRPVRTRASGDPGTRESAPTGCVARLPATGPIVTTIFSGRRHAIGRVAMARPPRLRICRKIAALFLSAPPRRTSDEARSMVTETRIEIHSRNYAGAVDPARNERRYRHRQSDL